MGMAVFFAFAAVALVSAVLVVTSRQVVYSAVYLVVTFLAVAGLFILQGAEFLGAVQILLYAGSIVVMFVFVVMMVNFRESLGPKWSSFKSLAGVVLGAVVFAELAWIVKSSAGFLSKPSIAVEGKPGHIEYLGDILFRQYLLPFEILSLVLLAALFGLLVIGKEEIDMVPVSYYIVLSAALFAIGLAGVLIRRNVLVMLMSVELMINAVNLNFIAFSNLHETYSGMVMVLFVIGVEAAELAVALTAILAYYRHRETLDSDRITLLKG